MYYALNLLVFFFFFQAEDGIRDLTVTGVQTCALPICLSSRDATKRKRRNGRETCQVRGIRSGTSPASNLRLRQCFSTSEDKGQRRASCVSDRAAQRRWRRLAEPVESLRLPENQNSVLLRVLSQTLPHTWTAAFCLHCPSVTGGL